MAFVFTYVTSLLRLVTCPHASVTFRQIFIRTEPKYIYKSVTIILLQKSKISFRCTISALVTWELDSFFVKFKNLLRAEKDATITFKSEAGKASVSLTVDLGHVLSGQDQLPPHGPRNGPARQRRREKRSTERAEKASTEKVENEEAELTEKVEEAPSSIISGNPAAEEAQEVETFAKVDEQNDEDKDNTAGKVVKPIEDVTDEVCPDEMYEKPAKLKVSVETQTLECGVRPPALSKSSLDFYTLTYDDYDSD